MAAWHLAVAMNFCVVRGQEHDEESKLQAPVIAFTMGHRLRQDEVSKGLKRLRLDAFGDHKFLIFAICVWCAWVISGSPCYVKNVGNSYICPA